MRRVWKIVHVKVKKRKKKQRRRKRRLRDGGEKEETDQHGGKMRIREEVGEITKSRMQRGMRRRVRKRRKQGGTDEERRLGMKEETVRERSE